MRFLRNDSGLSLTELLVVSVLIGVILASAYLLFGAGQAMSDKLIARSNAAFDAQKAVDKVSKDLRQSQSANPQDGKNGDGIVVGDINALASQNNVLTIFSNTDINESPPIPELVQYYSVASGSYYSLMRRVARHNPALEAVPNQPPFMYPVANPVWGAPEVVVQRLTQPAYFCFHRTPVSSAASEIAVNSCGSDPSHKYPFPPTDAASSNRDVSFVGISIMVLGTSGEAKIVVPGYAVVRVRTASGNEVDQ